MRLALIALIMLALGGSASAEVEFVNPDFGSDGNLLFAAQEQLPGNGSVKTLYRANPDSGKLEALSAYPERVFLVDEGRTLLVQNRFGLFQTGSAGGALRAVPGYPSFAGESTVGAGRVPTISPSPDGAYLVYAEQVSAASCRLVLLNKSTGGKSILADGIASSVENFPARWSPDSRYFIYSKAGSLYYFSIDQFSTKRLLDESLRRIGAGQIAAVRWGSDGSLFYLRGTSMYRILPAEFFTQALYQGLAGMGSLAGKMPFSFDPNFDEFWVDGSGSRILLRKGEHNIFLIYLSPDDYEGGPKMCALPYLFLEGGTTVRQVLWPKDGPVTVFAQSLGEASDRRGIAYRFEAPYRAEDYSPASAGGAAPAAAPDTGSAAELALSPDGRLLALVEPEGLRILDYRRWSEIGFIPVPGVFRALWTDSSHIVAAGSNTIELIELSGAAGAAQGSAGGAALLKSRHLIALSAVDSFGWTQGGLPFAARAGKNYSLAAGDSSWQESPEARALPARNSSASYRAYLETAGAEPFKNTIMLRSARALGTKQLIQPPPSRLASLAGPEDPDGNGFNHGLRTRRRELSLSFDLTESSEGLTEVLNTLKDYGIRATFYVNGEFIRQNPGAARLLARSGQETGSMFFSLVDLTDARIRADREYMRRGLAKTEDDWYSCTGKELSLLWHSPYYAVNSAILEAGTSMNYRYTGRDMDPLDWVTKADSPDMPGAYRSTGAIIEAIAASAKPGAIIPVRLGCSQGGRDDYLFLELDLLINALEEKGFEIVPVSALIDHTK